MWNIGPLTSIKVSTGENLKSPNKSIAFIKRKMDAKTNLQSKRKSIQSK